MIATSVSFTRPLVVKQASSQKHRTVVMALAPKQEEACPALDRRSMIIPLMVLPALLLVAQPANALGKDVRQAAKESKARKAKMREAMKAKAAAVQSAAPAAAAPAAAEAAE